MADLTTFIPVRQQARRARSRRSRPSARRTRSRCEIRTEDAATILLRYEGGARGSVADQPAQPRAARTASQYEIDGSSAAVAWDSEQPEQLWIGHRDRPNELLLRNPALMNAAGRRRRGCRAATSRASPTRSARCSAPSTPTSPRAARRRAALRRPSRDGHEEMLVGDAIAESARTGAWVDVSRARASAVRDDPHAGHERSQPR